LLRPYSSALLLAGIAAVLLAGGFATGATVVVGAGFASLGAAATKAVDVAQERHRRAVEEDASRRRDLDETRRVIYMALLAGATNRYELAATIVNALAHHGLAVDSEAAKTHALAVVERGRDSGGESRRWLERQIERINAELSS